MIKVMSAQWGGACQSCRASYLPGSTIGYDTDQRTVVQCLACQPQLVSQDPTNTAQGALATCIVVVRAIRHVSPDGFTILQVRFQGGAPSEGAPIGGDRDFGVKGKMSKVSLEDTLEVKGTWQRGKFGWEIKATTVLPVVAHTEQALRAFLAKFPHIGPVVAGDIIRTFGGREATLRVLEQQPERLTEVRGITPARAREIADAYRTASALRETALWLASLNLTESLTAAILDEYGEDAKARITEDPYCLVELRGVGFLKADDVARSRLGVEPTDQRRLAAAVLYLLEDQESGYDGGHTYTAEESLTGVPRIPPAGASFTF